MVTKYILQLRHYHHRVAASLRLQVARRPRSESILTTQCDKLCNGRVYPKVDTFRPCLTEREIGRDHDSDSDTVDKIMTSLQKPF